MTKFEAKNKLKKAKNLLAFQELFFSDDGNGDITADFEIVYKSQMGDGYTDNPSAKAYDGLGRCTNSFMKLEDGYLKYPF